MSSIHVCGDYNIIEDEGVEKGIFFRNPIQKVTFETYDYDTRFSAFEYLNNIRKNPIKRLYEIIIGNLNIIKNIEKWSEEYDWAGFTANILCFPIYFKRKYRVLEAISMNNNKNIQSIRSYGYESEFCNVAGNCVKEVTCLTFKNKKQQKIIKKDRYYYTYLHIIKDELLKVEK